MFHVDPNEMIARNLALREHELRRTAERARLLGDRRDSGPTARALSRALRGTAASLTALPRRIGRRRASVQEGRA